MPDITDKNKQIIKTILRKYCQIITKIPFENGIVLYTATYNELFASSARWRICLLCGEIRRSNDFTTQNHDCSPTFHHNFPILVNTTDTDLSSKA